MDRMYFFDAILFPTDGRPPHVVKRMASLAFYTNPQLFHASVAGDALIPHPEIHMEYIAEVVGARGWNYQLVEALDGMNKKFANPYIIFFPVISRDGQPFPLNRTLRKIQGRLHRSEFAWMGDIVIAKYRDSRFAQMMDASMADFPILKNYLSTHGCPDKLRVLPSQRLAPVPSSADSTLGITTEEHSPTPDAESISFKTLESTVETL
ncbi:hypothetical protein OF83DRAFT_1175304 [Amylostereum chailletii]|nr:hypothetical protein OF83DRAFT_1175304 [Amylostereum chailletii]